MPFCHLTLEISIITWGIIWYTCHLLWFKTNTSCVRNRLLFSLKWGGPSNFPVVVVFQKIFFFNADYLLFRENMALHLNKHGSPLSKIDLSKICLKFIQGILITCHHIFTIFFPLSSLWKGCDFSFEQFWIYFPQLLNGRFA